MSALHDALLGWSDRAWRDLPWRRTRDPWAILVSELMLQQTQVGRVVPRFEAFMARFPTPAVCADEGVGEVVAAWSGLGYNRRAVNLHRAAEIICRRHDGQVPMALDELVALPGVGPYTARAVLVFAHELDVGVVDTNVARVLSRLAGAALGPKALQERADALVPRGRAWVWTQALFDLGATVCRARDPRCPSCPVREHCAWRGAGADPARPSPRQSRFEGSDRQGRGRLVEAMRRGPVAVSDLAAVMGWPGEPERAGRVAATLVDDGLAAPSADGTHLALP